MRSSTLISTEGVADLRRVDVLQDRVVVGGAATLTTLEEAVGDALPALAKILAVFASRQIRNRATLAGNIATASPIGDLPPVESAPGHQPASSKTEPARPTRRDGTSRIDWASLLRRVFKVDVLACARCNGQMRVISVIEEPPVIEKILRHLGLPHVPLPTAPAQGQKAFAFEAA